MGQEFFVKSADLESKVRQLLPSQGGLGAGFDLSASTQIIPIIDLTESAEGSNVRPDLQTAISFNDNTAFAISNATVTITNTTGYHRIFGVSSARGDYQNNFILSDGVSTKNVWGHWSEGNIQFDFVVFLSAGTIIQGQTTNASAYLNGSSKQIATIDGILTSPS